MILTFIIIIVVLLLWGNNRAKQKAVRERIAYFEKKDKQAKSSRERNDRFDRIYSVLFHLEIYKDIINGDKRKTTENYYRSSIESVKECQPTTEDIKVAIRYFKIQHANNKCDHFIKPDEEEKIYKIIESLKK